MPSFQICKSRGGREKEDGTRELQLLFLLFNNRQHDARLVIPSPKASDPSISWRWPISPALLLPRDAERESTRGYRSDNFLDLTFHEACPVISGIHEDSPYPQRHYLGLSWPPPSSLRPEGSSRDHTQRQLRLAHPDKGWTPGSKEYNFKRIPSRSTVHTLSQQL